MRLLKWFGLSAFLWHSAANASVCEISTLTYPPPGSQITDSQPEITWERKAPGNYRVQVAVILPETRVIATSDLVNGDNRYKFPTPILPSLASVKVLVSQGCEDNDSQDINAQGPAFFINTRFKCSLSQSSLKQVAGKVIWKPVEQAQRYLVRLFEVGLGQNSVARSTLVSTSEIAEPGWPVPLAAGTSGSDGDRQTVTRVATVQAICSGITGSVQEIAIDDSP